MGKIFYDIIPPKAVNVKIKPNNFKNSIAKIAVFGLIAALSWAGISSIHRTAAYFNDVEESQNDSFVAGTLDFELSSNQIFSNLVLGPGESATGTISVINLDNVPQYKVKSDSLSGELCDYLNLEASLDGIAEYSGKLKDFDFGPTIFQGPDDWFFTLTLPASTTGDVIGKSCNFNFVFYGSQIKNNLPFGQGFTDTEDANSSIKSLMCFDSEIRSKGYWKNHLNVTQTYLPQMLGNEIVDSTSSAYRILGADYDLSMINKLKGQLLTLKLNIADFGIGDYIPTSSANSLSQIADQADDLLKQNPAPDNSILEEMKDLLDGLNNDLKIKVCTETGVKVLIPNGGEKWWIGESYDLTWITKNLGCPDDLAYIDIWYSNDSGSTWGKVASSTENDGVYNWRAPLFLENNTYYIPSEKARIKVVAVCSENMMVAGWDMSDYDFCPPINKDLLTPEELELAKALGLIQEETTTQESIVTEEQDIETTSTEPAVLDVGSVSAPVSEETASGGGNQSPVTEIPAVTQENSINAGQTSTSIEEISAPADQGIIETINNIIENVVNGIIEAINPEATTTEPAKNSTTTETATIEQVPVVEQQPTVIPENNQTDQAPPSDNSSSGGGVIGE